MLSCESVPTGPVLAPLVTGSATARALYEVWSGSHSTRVVIEGPEARMAAAVTIACHLAARADQKVALVTTGLYERGVAIVKASEQIPPSLIACPAHRSLTFRLASGWLYPALTGANGVTVVAQGVNVLGDVIKTLAASDIVVLVDGETAVPPHEFSGRQIRVSATGGDGPRTPHPWFRLGDIPLDVVLAGAP